MPVARGPQVNARSAIVVGLTGVVIALLLGAMVLFVASSSDRVEIQLGDTDFNAGQIGRISDAIDDDGPILYPDVGSGGTRDISLQHLGDDPETGWLAFAARRAGDPRECFIDWVAESREFVLTSLGDVGCESVTFDERGTGLEQYPIDIRDGEVHVLLNEGTEE